MADISCARPPTAIPPPPKSPCVVHFFNVVYIGLDQRREGLEFRTGPKALQMSFFRIPFDSRKCSSRDLRRSAKAHNASNGLRRLELPRPFHRLVRKVGGAFRQFCTVCVRQSYSPLILPSPVRARAPRATVRQSRPRTENSLDSQRFNDSMRHGRTRKLLLACD